MSDYEDYVINLTADQILERIADIVIAAGFEVAIDEYTSDKCNYYTIEDEGGNRLLDEVLWSIERNQYDELYALVTECRQRREVKRYE